MDQIIVGVDRTDTAHRAAFAASDLAACSGANLHLVTCIRDSAPYEGANRKDTRKIDSIAEAEVFLRRLKESLPNTQVTTSVSLAEPAVGLCDEAIRLQASVIVVGNRRVRGPGRVLGSIASDVARRADCHVLIANTTGDR
ncbi:MAG: universal stress protein [Ilumatobacter sp.]|nr:universal stress protein [Ilumatobacter sp.]